MDSVWDNLFAHTPPVLNYPPYVSLNKDRLGKYWLTVRSEGHFGEKSGTIELSSELLYALADAIRDKIEPAA